MKDAEAVVFWIKTPDTVNGEATTDPDALKMYMNIFDTSSGERVMRSRVVDGSQNLTMISTKDGTVQTQPSSWYLKIPTAFEGYVVIPAAAWTDFQIQYFSEVQIWFEETAETFLLDNIGVTGDAQACITGLSKLYTPDQGGEDEDDGKVDHTTHPDNANMTVLNGMESLDQISYKSVPAEMDTSSPDGSNFKFQPTAQGGEINLLVDQSKADALKDAEAIVFWIKTPDVGSTCSYFGVYDQRPDEPRYEFGYTRGEASTSFRVVSAADGSVQTIQNGWYVNLPANFEGYVIFDKEMFNAPSGSNPDKTFDITHFSELKWYFEPGQPIAGEDFYIDDIGVTSDVDAYIAGLKALYGSEAAPDDHNRHPDNKNMSVACGLESLDQIGYNSVSVMELSDISPDGSCLRFRPSNSGGELNFNMTSNTEAFKDAQAIVFWVKTPDVAEPAVHMAVYDQRPDTARKQFGLPNGGYSIRTVSALTGEVKTIDCGWYIDIPSNFEGYVIIDKAAFSNVNEGDSGDVLDIQYMTQLKWYFEGGTVILPNVTEDYYIDDIGVTSNVDAYIESLAELYEKDTPTDPEEPTDPGDPGEDDRPAYEEGPLTPTEGYTVEAVEAAGNEARLTWESIEGVDKYVVHLYRLGKGDGGETLYTYVDTFTADEGASSIVLTDLTALTDYAAQLVAMTSTDEIIFAYELKTFRTLEPGVELKDPSGEEPGTEEPGGEETDDGIPDTGVSLPAAAILLGLLAAGGMLALRRKSK